MCVNSESPKKIILMIIVMEQLKHASLSFLSFEVGSKKCVVMSTTSINNTSISLVIKQ